jgi:hypothetical protein
MGRKRELIRYAYWSDRRVRSIAEDNGIEVSRTLKTKLSVFKVPLTSTSLDLERESRTLYRTEIARRLEKAFAGTAVEDLSTPPPVRLAKGTGVVQFSHFVAPRPNQVVMNTRIQASDGTRAVVCLFGSKDNVARYVGPDDKCEAGWTSSEMWSVLNWLGSRCQADGSPRDDPQYLSVEAMKIATHQGTNDRFSDDPSQPWNRGYTFADASDSDWFAEIYSDVILDRDRWSLDEPVDRILVGAPLWIRTPGTRVRRYRDLRNRLGR